MAIPSEAACGSEATKPGTHNKDIHFSLTRCRCCTQRRSFLMNRKPARPAFRGPSAEYRISRSLRCGGLGDPEPWFSAAAKRSIVKAGNSTQLAFPTSCFCFLWPVFILLTTLLELALNSVHYYLELSRLINSVISMHSSKLNSPGWRHISIRSKDLPPALECRQQDLGPFELAFHDTTLFRPHAQNDTSV